MRSIHLPSKAELIIFWERRRDDVHFLFLDIRDFGRVLYYYLERRIRQYARQFEGQKDDIVGFLMAKRGNYQRPFLHTSFFILIGAGIIGAPIIANSYSDSTDQLAQYTPSSGVVNTLDMYEFATSTQVSDKPRDITVTYAVREGDTLSSIADKFGVSMDTIKWANPDLKGEKLSIGQKIQIPPVTGLVVKVGRGETIYSIAKKYKTEAQKILNYPFNDFADLDTFALSAGQVLVVPDGVPVSQRAIYAPIQIPSTIAGGNGQFAWPTQGLITQYPVSYHMAVDIANSSAPPVGAAEAVTVVLAESSRYGYGLHIIVDHGNGYQTLYAHLSAIYVGAGDSVGRGTVIGRMGSTGRSTGTHLHFEVRQGGVLLNPLPFLSK